MSAVYYCPLQTIREEAGRQSIVNNEVPTGSVNGSNKIFYVGSLPIVDRNYDDTVDASDVIAYVNGIPVEVDTVDPDTGAVTLVNAPSNGADVTISYAYSESTDTRVNDLRIEAQDWLNNRIKSFYDLSTLKSNNIPSQFRTFIRLYAGGLILIRDHGAHADLEDTSKDGYKKLETARDLVTEYIADIKDDSESKSPIAPVVKTDGAIFQRLNNLDDGPSEYPDTENFMRKR